MRTQRLRSPIPILVLWLLIAILWLSVFISPVTLAQLTFTDATKEAGVGDSQSANGVAFADYDSDGFLDILVTNGWGGQDVLYRNNTDKTFTNVTKAAGIGLSSFGIACGDYDNDGDRDIYLTRKDLPNVLYRNNGDGTFTDVAKQADVANALYGFGVAFGDYDKDGNLDIYVADRSPNALYHGNGDGTFTNVTDKAGVKDSNRAAGALFGDYDNDGFLDIYLVNAPGVSGVLYRNNGDGTFTNTTADAKVNKPIGWAVDATFGDYDNDGSLDLYLGNFNGPNVLYHNNGDRTFTDVTSQAKVGNARRAEGVMFGDYDNDGFLDIYVGNWGGDPNVLYHNNGDGTFADVTQKAGVIGGGGTTQGVASGDYDNDGFLDIYLAKEGSANLLYHNDGNANHWLAVQPQGTVSNRDGIGVRIRVTAGILTMIREINTGDGRNGGELWACFGLGANPQADLVEIYWPSGMVDTLRDVLADQQIRVLEGSFDLEPHGKLPITLGQVKRTVLLQNYPNPFNPETWIPFVLHEAAEVEIRIYDVSGNRVRTLTLGQKASGEYSGRAQAAYWDGRNDAGEALGSGIYFYGMRAGDYASVRRAMLRR